jgi:hypothetical protein
MPSYLLDFCPRTTVYVSSYYWTHTTICAYFSRYLGPLLPPPQVPSYSAYCYMCPRTTIYVSSHTIYVSSYYYICILLPQIWQDPLTLHTAICVSLHYYICVLSYYICVLILLYMHTAPTIYAYCSLRYGKTLCQHRTHPRETLHTAICVSSYYYICVLILLYMHTAPADMARPSTSTGPVHAHRRAADQGAQARGDAAGITPYVSICQHTSAYVSIRQHTSRRSGSISAR